MICLGSVWQIVGDVLGRFMWLSGEAFRQLLGQRVEETKDKTQIKTNPRFK